MSSRFPSVSVNQRNALSAVLASLDGVAPDTLRKFSEVVRLLNDVRLDSSAEDASAMSFHTFATLTAIARKGEARSVDDTTHATQALTTQIQIIHA